MKCISCEQEAEKGNICNFCKIICDATQIIKKWSRVN